MFNTQTRTIYASVYQVKLIVNNYHFQNTQDLMYTTLVKGEILINVRN